MTEVQESALGRDASTYRAHRIAQWNTVGAARRTRRGPTRAYHRRLQRIYRFLIAPGLRVLELGCSEGDLLAAVQPSRGVGVDFSPKMLVRARQRHPELEFVEA